MSVYTKFAIIGAGGVGGTVADELLKKSDVSVACRLARVTSGDLMPRHLATGDLMLSLHSR
ncbi:hypothetical protein P3T76_015188 [Phytophthora citrophthora]|uniref:Uncharacterized protein n=1 Tax=Phytophthora citrophthora TaxID=4793 RepID=A0AAD9FZJ5_9STRA|nr:hypothetical protein P3T76_015188 [Phytophthora citrophthora]